MTIMDPIWTSPRLVHIGVDSTINSNNATTSDFDSQGIATDGWRFLPLGLATLLGAGQGKPQKWIFVVPTDSSRHTYTRHAQVWVKPSAEMSFLYGNHVLKSGVGKVSEGLPANTGVVVLSMANIPLGFGVSVKTTSEIRSLDPSAIVVLHQADIGEPAAYGWLTVLRPCCITQLLLATLLSLRLCCLASVLYAHRVIRMWGAACFTACDMQSHRHNLRIEPVVDSPVALFLLLCSAQPP